MYDHQSYGPTFGYDNLRIESNPTSSNCYTDLDYNYRYTGGGSIDFTNDNYFRVIDYEVYKVG